MAPDQFEDVPVNDLGDETISHQKPGRAGDTLLGVLKVLGRRVLPSKKTGGRLKWAVIGLLILTGVRTSVRYVGPNEVGVRTNEFTIPFIAERGVEQVSYGPGLHIVPPFITHMNTLSTQLQKVTMSAEADNDGFGNDELRFRTRDGNDIKLNVDFKRFVTHLLYKFFGFF